MRKFEHNKIIKSVNQKLVKYINAINGLRLLTAERPLLLESDVKARYGFALKHCKRKSVLDIGTGFGLGAKYIAENGAKLVLGVDYNKVLISQLQKENKLSNLQFLYSEASSLHKLGKKFDVILAFEIIEHLPLSETENFVRAISKLLNKGGVLLLTTPNGAKTSFVLGKPYNPYHVKEYKAQELEELLKPHFPSVTVKGLKNKDSKYLKQQKKITQGLLYKIIYFFGHFKLVRETVVFVPKVLRKHITGESSLPETNDKDFVLVNNFRIAPGLWVNAKRK